MRAGVDGLASPHPLLPRLPGLFQDDPFTARFLLGFDEVLAPLFTVLAGLEAYLDPRQAPPDFVDWLGGWLGLPPQAQLPLERRRALVAQASVLHALRGTAEGLQGLLEAVTDAEVELEHSGAVTTSEDPGAPLPGDPDPCVRVGLRGLDAAAVAALVPLVRTWVPAHVRVELRAVPGARAPRRRG